MFSPSVGPSVRRSVGPSVRQSVGPSVMLESKSGKTSVLDVFLGMCIAGGAWGVDGGWTPLPTRPQRYCDPTSLVCLYSMMTDESIFRE